jgi:GNAT superfamily N-acetyltransferase
MLSEVSIRPARLPNDAVELAEIYLSSAGRHTRLDPDRYRIPDRDLLVAHFTQIYDGVGDQIILVAESDHGLIGYVEACRRAEPPPTSMLKPVPTASIDIAVLDSHRGRGIGRSLMNAAADWANRQQIGSLVLDVLLANTAAVGFYSSCGYRPYGQLMEYQPPAHRHTG